MQRDPTNVAHNPTVPAKPPCKPCMKTREMLRRYLAQFSTQAAVSRQMPLPPGVQK